MHTYLDKYKSAWVIYLANFILINNIDLLRAMLIFPCIHFICNEQFLKLVAKRPLGNYDVIIRTQKPIWEHVRYVGF